ncbi:sn-glycerol-3-phosphate transport system permease protein UgpE [Bacillus sp. J14TS2]|uniref:carbohydrate ABC transporter permease n=1 Tax=Bacillus sp. J14TS2 TaxID=2807188 RepID=UPI001B2ACD95|nr:carbohydrate ABC transporter permease [Bacillus sp. J14TS2]GIN71436.1 sn-glycerol-3-phosphate transport system permease protein UgpE [Bacillus sp. J14TS2]
MGNSRIVPQRKQFQQTNISRIKPNKRIEKITTVLLYLLHILLAAIVLFPILFAVVSSFRPLEDIFRYVSPISWKTFIPTEITFDAYMNLFTERGFGRVFLNTFFVSIVTVVFAVYINSMAAFAFAKFEFKGKTVLFLLVLLTFMIPFEVIAIPLYNIVDGLSWLDSYYGLIVPGIANGIVIFLYRQFFTDIPDSLIEAAKIDGASWWKIYWKIVMPLCKPVTVSASLLVFIFSWESFMWPLIVTQSKKYKVLQVAMGDFVTEHATFWNEMFAASVLGIIVPVLLILPMQKYFVQGISNTGAKE